MQLLWGLGWEPFSCERDPFVRVRARAFLCVLVVATARQGELALKIIICRSMENILGFPNRGFRKVLQKSIFHGNRF